MEHKCDGDSKQLVRISMDEAVRRYERGVEIILVPVGRMPYETPLTFHSVVPFKEYCPDWPKGGAPELFRRDCDTLSQMFFNGAGTYGVDCYATA